MTATFQPSLKHRTFVMITAAICDDKDLRFYINELDFVYDKVGAKDKWKRIRDKATEKISEVNLPPPLQRGILALIKPMALEIARWRVDHLDLLGYEFDYNTCQLFWSPEGLVDKRKTVENVLVDESLCKVRRFRLACCYCHEKHISRIWSIMSGEEKSRIYRKHFNSSVRFWLSWLRRNGEFNLSSLLAKELLVQLYTSTISNYIGNLNWLRYFFDQLCSEERKMCIEYTVKGTVKDHDNYRFCISKLDENQREIFFREDPFRLLRFFLDWPYQSLFSEAAQQMWKYLHKNDFRTLLHFIIYSRIVDDWCDFDYVTLFKDFWQQSPRHLKEFIEKDLIFEPVKMIVDHNYLQPFPKEEIIKSFYYVPQPCDKFILQREGDFSNTF